MAITIVGAVLRVPTATSRAVLGYDDGAYLASMLAMREGGAPFRDVYSSQGPAFLPLLRIGDAGSFGWPFGARMVPVLAGLATVMIVHRLALRVAGGTSALVAATLVATSGSLLFSTSRIESDGLTAALGAGAVLAATGPGTRRAVVSVLLIGVAVSVKSLMAAPALLAVLWLLGRRYGSRAILPAVIGIGAVVLLVSIPWGLVDVWNQSVQLHLAARQSHLDLGARISYLREQFWRRDRLIVVAAALGVATWVVGQRWPRRRDHDPANDVTIALWIWLAASLLLVVLHSPLFVQHLTVVIAPAAILAARRHLPIAAMTAVAVLLVPGHGAGAGWRLTRETTSPAQREIIDLLSSVEPADALIITDAPALGWLADRATPGSLVDPSHVRIDAGELSVTDVVAAAHEPGVCAVLFWSGRLDELPNLRRSLHDYRPVFAEGEHVLLLRSGCALSATVGGARDA